MSMRLLGVVVAMVMVAGCATSRQAARPQGTGGGGDQGVPPARAEKAQQPEARSNKRPVASRHSKQSPQRAVRRPVPRASPRVGVKVAARASRLVGVKSLGRVSKRVPDDCTGLVRIAAEPEGLVLFDDNARASDNGVTAMFRRAKAAGALHWRRPRPGDLVFFRETYDRNRDGKRNDGLTHIGVVESVGRDGTVVFVHRGGSGVTRARVNPMRPRDKTRNDYLRRADSQTRAYLTGELFSVYASSAKLKQ